MAKHPPTQKSKPARRRCRLPQRNVLILVLAFGCGLGAGGLLATAGVVVGQAILGGCTAFVASFYFFEGLIE